MALQAQSELLWLGGGVASLLILSGLDPVADRYTWFLETLPVMIGLPLLYYTWQGFPLTILVYRLLALHAVILIIGGYYTYAEVPLFNWLRDSYELSRNHYDRIGHFFQGFVPAMLAREILLRRSPLRPGRWLFFLCICFCLAFSAFYELIEWWVALMSEQAAEAFLGTQGDPWDTQTDMFLALIGAICAQLLLVKIHNRQLFRLGAI
ncbi:MAG: DUF2238 domain-containing protein [Candidatus Thiodiazotropha sp.]